MGVVIIREAGTGKRGPDEICSFMALMVMCHGLVEDTPIMAAIVGCRYLLGRNLFFAYFQLCTWQNFARAVFLQACLTGQKCMAVSLGERVCDVYRQGRNIRSVYTVAESGAKLPIDRFGREWEAFNDGSPRRAEQESRESVWRDY